MKQISKILFTALSRSYPKLCISISVLTLLLPPSSFAGAWANKPGESTLINGVYYFHFTQFKDPEGKTQPRADFIKYEYKPYYEYGITNGFSGGFSPSFQHVKGEYVNSVETGADKNEAFVYSDVFIKKELYRSDNGDQVFSIIPMVEIPGIYKEQNTPFFGKKESFWNLIASLGQNLYSIKNNYGYVNVEAGIRSRFTDAFTDDGGSSFKSDVQLSLPVFENISTMVGMNYTKALSGYASSQSFLDRFGYDSLQYSIGGIYFVDNYSKIQCDFITQDYSRNSGLGEGIKFSFWHSF